MIRKYVTASGVIVEMPFHPADQLPPESGWLLTKR